MNTEPPPNEEAAAYPSPGPAEPEFGAPPAPRPPLPYRPDWVPASGHQLSRTGVQFDAVRIAGLRAEEVADELADETDDAAGPIIREAVGARWMYFLCPPGSATDYRWPPGIMRLSGTSTSVGYVGVPALHGDTWPLSWYSRPTEQAPFVDPALLYATLCRLVGWRPLTELA
jgi:hypothetical protein